MRHVLLVAALFVGLAVGNALAQQRQHVEPTTEEAKRLQEELDKHIQDKVLATDRRRAERLKASLAAQDRLRLATSRSDLNSTDTAILLEDARHFDSKALSIVPRLVTLGVISSPADFGDAELPRLIALHTMKWFRQINAQEADAEMLAIARTYYPKLQRQRNFGGDEYVWAKLSEWILPILIQQPLDEVAPLLVYILSDFRLYATDDPRRILRAAGWTPKPIVVALGNRPDPLARQILWDALERIGKRGIQESLMSIIGEPDSSVAVNVLATAWFDSAESPREDIEELRRLLDEWKTLCPEDPGITVKELHEGSVRWMEQGVHPPSGDEFFLRLTTMRSAHLYEEYQRSITALEAFIQTHASP